MELYNLAIKYQKSKSYQIAKQHWADIMFKMKKDEFLRNMKICKSREYDRAHL